MCTSYRGITLLSLPGKVYSMVLERRVHLIVKPRVEEEQCGFHPRPGTTDQLFTLTRILEGALEFVQTLYICLVDLEKTNDRAPWGILWEVLQEYRVRGSPLRAIQSMYTPK